MCWEPWKRVQGRTCGSLALAGIGSYSAPHRMARALRLGGMEMFTRQLAKDRDRSPKRGWGPFTGAQLTVLIVAALLAVAFPTGLWAATATSTAITDSTGTNFAKVSASGSLQTSIAGTVATQIAKPSQFLFQVPVSIHSTDSCTLLATAPAGEALIVSQIHWIVGANANTLVKVFAGNQCTASLNDEFPFSSGSVMGDHLETFSPGMPVSTGHSIYASTNFNAMTAVVQGYLVPAAQCNGGTGCG